MRYKPGDILVGRYYTTSTSCIAVVAQIGNIGTDWAAYIGSYPITHPALFSEAATISLAVSTGAKLTQEDARFFFPSLKDLEYRP